MDNNLLEIQNLDIFIKNNPILLNINLKIEKGEFIFLKGANGSGKTTFLNVLSGMNKEGNYSIQGKILFNNEYDILSLSVKNMHLYRRQRHFLEQTGPDFDTTVLRKFYDIVEIIFPGQLKERDIYDFLENYNAKSMFPGINYEKLLRKKISSMSEGQKKMISILAGFMRAQYVKLLIADEPLNHLDSNNIKKIIDLFKVFRKKYPDLSIIITTHCQAFPQPDKFLVINNKNIKPSPVSYQHYDCYNLM